MALPGRDRWRNKEEERDRGRGGRGEDELEIICGVERDESAGEGVSIVWDKSERMREKDVKEELSSYQYFVR